MQAFSIKEAIKYGWKSTREHIVFLVSLVVGIFASNARFSYAEELLSSTGNNLIVFTLFVVSLLISFLLGIGLIYITLKIYDENKAAYKDLLEPAPLLWRFIGASAVYTLIVIAGLILFVVPGIIWAIKYKFYKYALIDEKLGVMDSIRKSRDITEGEKWNIFLFGLVLALINILGALALFVGLFVTIPITIMATVYVYRKLLHRELVPVPETPKV